MLKELKICLGVLVVSTPLALSVYANSNNIGTDDSYYNNCLRRLEDNSVCFKGMTEDDFHELYNTNSHVPVQSTNTYVPSEHYYGFGECEHGRPATSVGDSFVKGEKMITYKDGCVKFIKR